MGASRIREEHRGGAGREGHFMSPGLLDSPFAALEAAVSDERPIPIGIAAPPETIADRVVAQRAAETRGRPGAE